MNKREAFKKSANLYGSSIKSLSSSRTELQAELVEMQRASMEMGKKISEFQANKDTRSPHHSRLVGDKKDLGIRILAMQSRLGEINRAITQAQQVDSEVTQDDWDGFYRVVRYIQSKNKVKA